jgi:hypothetical protein
VLRSSLKPSLIKQLTQIVDDEIPDHDANEDDWNLSNDSILDWKHGDELGHLGILGFILALILMHGRSIDNSASRDLTHPLSNDYPCYSEY